MLKHVLYNMLSLTHILITLLKVMLVFVKPCSHAALKKIAAENIALKQQLLVLNRGRSRSPQLTATDRWIFALTSLWITPQRLARIAIVLKPATLLAFHRCLIKRKYCRLFSNTACKPGPKGPSQELVDLILEIKRRNPRYGCPKIADTVNSTFSFNINKDIVRRVLQQHFKPTPRNKGPSWLSFLGHTKDSLWSLDFFRCESITLKSHWVMVVMDQYSRRIIGFAVNAGHLDGPMICRMFNSIIKQHKPPGKLSSDNDPLFQYQQWQANLRILEIEELKSLPYIPLSHPFVERLIGSVRRECLDQTLFWTATDLQQKLDGYKDYYNHARPHQGINGLIPAHKADNLAKPPASLTQYRWQSHCRGLFHTPTPA